MNSQSELISLTRPNIISFHKNTGWVCNLCKEIPSIKAKTLRVKRYHKLKANWELKKDIYWSDGTPVTAKDVKFTAKLLDHKSFQIKLDQSNPKKFIVEYDTTSFDFYQNFTFSILPSHKSQDLEKEKFSLDGYSYGPYKISSVEDGELTLIENRFYNTPPKIKKLHYKYTNFENSSAKSPISFARSYSDISKLIKSENNKLSLRPQKTFNMDILAFNINNPILSELSIRKAIFINR